MWSLSHKPSVTLALPCEKEKSEALRFFFNIKTDETGLIPRHTPLSKAKISSGRPIGGLSPM